MLFSEDKKMPVGNDSDERYHAFRTVLERSARNRESAQESRDLLKSQIESERPDSDSEVH